MNPPTDNGLSPQKVGYAQATMLYRFGRVLCRLATTGMFGLKVFGLPKVPRQGGVLIVGNHQSYLDPVLYAVRIQRPVGFMAKSELFEGNRAFGWLIRNLNAFPVRQGRFDRASLREIVNRLQAGRVVVLFPEGGRTETGEIEPFQRGVGLIVRQAGPGVRVVPGAVHGAYQAWDRYHKLPRPSPVYLQYGEPMELSHLDDREIVKVLDEKVRGIFEGLRRRFPMSEPSAGSRCHVADVT